jgi:3',5'-nucleoside bisphosphate phosphatase
VISDPLVAAPERLSIRWPRSIAVGKFQRRVRMLIELHCHTSVDPATAVRQAERVGLQGLVLIEHGQLWTARALAELRRVAEIDEGFVLLAGQEVLTEIGPVLVLGADRSLPGRHALTELRSAWPEAALIWSHPYRQDRQPSEEQLLHACLDAVEIISGAHTHLAHARSIDDWHRLKFVATAGSDAHRIEDVGRYPARLDHPITTLAQLCVELRAGRVRPMLEETPRAGANNRLMEIVLGPDEQRERVIV